MLAIDDDDIEYAIKQRGRTLYQEGSITVEKNHPEVLKAKIHSQSDRFINYTNYLLFKKTDGLSLFLAYCSCPYHQNNEEICKHNWALLLESEKYSIYQSALKAQKQQDEFSLVTFEEYVARSNDEIESVFGYIDSLLQDDNFVAVEEGWKDKLLRMQESLEEHKTLQTESKQQLYYGLSLSKKRDFNRDPSIELLQKYKLKNDKWSRLKKIEFNSFYHDLNHKIEDPVDREVVKDFELSLRGSSDHSSKVSSLVFPASMIYQSLKIIDEKTNRLLVFYRDQEDRDQKEISLLIEDKKYEFYCSIVSKGGSWVVQGGIKCGSDLVELSDDLYVMVFACFLIKENKLIKFTVSEDLKPIYMSLMQYNNLSVPKENKGDLLHFIKEYLPVEKVDIPPELSIEKHIVKGRPQVEFELGKKGIFGRLFFYYGDQKERPLNQKGTLESEDENILFIKDFEYENKILQELNNHEKITFQGSEYYYVYHIKASDFSEVSLFLKENNFSLKIQGKKIRPLFDVDIKVASGVDWFDVKGGANFDGVELSLPQILQRAKESSQGLFLLNNNEYGVLPEKWLSKLIKLGNISSAKLDAGLRFDRSHALVLDSILEETIDADKNFKILLDKLKQNVSYKKVRPSSLFVGSLRGYQLNGLSWMTYLQELRFGGCLADDMGLGKTIQVLALLQKRKSSRVKRESKTSLIVVPKSLITNWEEEAKKFTPNLKVLLHEGARRKGNIKNFKKYDLIVMTYAAMRADVADGSFREFLFDYVVLDEAQNIKNEKSQTAKASLLLRASHRLALSGTPIENHAGELFSIFKFLNPGLFHKHISSYKNSSGKNDTIEAFLRGLKPFILRRKKEDVLDDLPQKTESILYCDLVGSQKKEYEKIKKYYKSKLDKKIQRDGINKSKIVVLEALTRLRQAACHPGLLDSEKAFDPSSKIETLMEQIKIVESEGNKVLVFSQFTSLLSIVENEFKKEGILYSYLDGQTRNRKEVVEEFKTNKDIPVFLISLKAGGVGLNLTEANYCFILDPWWNPAVEQQAIDRMYRIGQNQHVMAYKMIMKNTVEEKILKLQEQKKKIYDDMLHLDHGLLKKMNLDDVKYLFS